MTIQEMITHYKDRWGLVTPTLQTLQANGRGSDNGVLHTSRYLIIQKQRGEELDLPALVSMLACVDSKGNLRRSPDDTTENTPDDHYGFISAANYLKLKGPKLVLPWKCMHPMLVYMRGIYNCNPLIHLFSPFMALLIAMSNRSTPDPITTDSTDRLLTWNIIQGTGSSWLCRLGAKIWHDKQEAIYGPNPVNRLFDIYYPRGVMHMFVSED